MYFKRLEIRLFQEFELKLLIYKYIWFSHRSCRGFYRKFFSTIPSKNSCFSENFHLCNIFLFSHCNAIKSQDTWKIIIYCLSSWSYLYIFHFIFIRYLSFLCFAYFISLENVLKCSIFIRWWFKWTFGRFVNFSKDLFEQIFVSSLFFVQLIGLI